MSFDPEHEAATATAYQDVTLHRLRGLFDQIDLDLDDVLAREETVARDLGEVSSQMDALRAQLAALGMQTERTTGTTEQSSRRGEQAAHDTPAAQQGSRYRVPATVRETDPEKLARRAEAHLERLGIDLSRDPLQQVLPDSQIAASLTTFAHEHGDITWTKTDWGVVLAAGAIATLLDVVIVRIPRGTWFLGRHQQGSPLTGWLQGQGARRVDPCEVPSPVRSHGEGALRCRDECGHRRARGRDEAGDPSSAELRARPAARLPLRCRGHHARDGHVRRPVGEDRAGGRRR
jgi:hypothetical protein